MAPLNAFSRARLAVPRRESQTGYILLVVLVALLLMLLGFLFFMRGTFSDAHMTGNVVQRYKDAQASDMALQIMSNKISQASSGSPLEITAASQPWYRNVAPGTAAPTAAYWSSCLNGSSGSNCWQVPLPNNIPYTALAVVQPTGRTDTYACQVTGYTAVYYDLFIHTVEQNGNTSADTESVYKLCVP